MMRNPLKMMIETNFISEFVNAFDENTFSHIFRAEPGQNIHDFGQNLSMRFEFVH